ncbi:MAG: NUDIX hydrolase [Polyangiaceae bacterium]|nr:NUDIX hydrolase [Polyangiaceae bacterium]
MTLGADGANSIKKECPQIAVGAVVIDDSSGACRRIVLVRRARPPMAGRFSLPGGRLEFGERIEAAVQREVFEESGLVVQVGPLVEVVEVIEPPYHYVILDYVCLRTGGELRAGDDASEVVFVVPGELERYGVTEAVVRVATKALTMV